MIVTVTLSVAQQMSNANILSRMREACDHWDHGSFDCLELGHRILALTSNLEGFGGHALDESRAWELALVFASEAGDREAVINELSEVVRRIRIWIDGLTAAA
jgi:hypothetical protein